MNRVYSYYPFGSKLPGRYAGGSEYRFGFQGQEGDDEHLGDGNSYAFKYRIHDARIGRFLSLDPLAPDYPHNSPYAFSENRVLDKIELEGAESFTPILLEPISFSIFNTQQNHQRAFLKNGDAPSTAYIKSVFSAHALYGAKLAAGAVAAEGIAISVLYYETIGIWIGTRTLLFGGTTLTGAGIANEGTAVVWGLLLDEEYPLPAVGDNFSKTGKHLAGEAFQSIYKKVNPTDSKETCAYACEAIDRLFRKLNYVPAPKHMDVNSYNKVVNNWMNLGTKNSIDDVIDFVRKENPRFDNSYIIGLDFGDGTSGHVFNVIKENGVIKVLDAQGDNVLKQLRNGDYDDDLIFTIYKSFSQ